MIDGRPYRQVNVDDIRPGGLLVVADHASNHVPAGIELGIDPKLMNDHIAIDIGVEGVADRLARRTARHGQCFIGVGIEDAACK